MMTEKQRENSNELRDFVEMHELRNRNSIIHFKAKVNLTTSNNKLTNVLMEVRVTFQEYNSLGLLTLMDDNLNPHIYPTQFEAKWQTFKNVDDIYLQIKDKHPNNDIGNYHIEIVPLGRIKD